MPLPQLLQCRRRCLHRSQHNLDHSEVDTAPVKVLVAAAALVDADVADADEVDVADADEEDGDEAGADEAGVDEVDAVWAQHVA